jgi:hypothetical protein
VAKTCQPCAGRTEDGSATEKMTAKAVAPVQRKDLDSLTDGFLNGFNTSYEVEEAAAAAAAGEAVAAKAKELKRKQQWELQWENQNRKRCDCEITGPPGVGTCDVCGAYNAC